MIASLISPIADIIGKLVPDADERNRLANEIATLAERQAHDQVLAQLEINKQSAAHKSLFVAGGRPAAVWVCVVAMGFNFVGLPLLQMGLAFAEIEAVGLHALDTSEMMPVLMGLLGLGGLRTFEKSKGVARER